LYCCVAKLDGKFYASKEGNLLCETHYFEESGRVCGGCGKPIIAGIILISLAGSPIVNLLMVS